MNKRYFVSSLFVFLFITVFEWIFHGIFLKDLYVQTSYLWRPEDQFIMPAMLLGQFSFAFIFSFIFVKGYENKGMIEGIRYGLLIGLLFIPSQLVMYAVQPLPANLVILWSVGGLVELAIAGAILAATYRTWKR
ncbi:MAG: hypothetical protein NUV91_04905 [Candidatus Omnitrophica bacterium]|nr:hypothetical protein [Candidatus Omnitrophota bacterium]